MAIADEIVQREVGSCVESLRTQSARALEVCDLLEALADDLPRRQAPLWKEVRRQSRTILMPHFRFLSEHVLPVLLARTEGDDERQDILLRFQSICLARVETSLQLQDLFVDVALSGRFRSEPDALGFALRSFFDAFRDDLIWQTDVLWPLTKRVLSKDDVPPILKAMRDDLGVD